MASKKAQCVLVWFTNDLRLHDNECLSRAIQAGKNVIPFYCFDPRTYGVSSVGKFEKTGARRAKFTIESVKNLKDNFKAIGGDLVVRHGIVEKVIADMLAEYKSIDAIYYQREVTSEELDIEKSVIAKAKEVKKDINITSFFGLTLYHPEDLPFKMQDLPNMYTGFRVIAEKKCDVRGLFPTPKAVSVLPDVDVGKIPTLEELGVKGSVAQDPRSAVLNFEGGETNALKRLENYLWGDNNPVAKYKQTRNGLIGSEFSTKFSIWLWNGCLSPRIIYHEIKRFEKEVVANDSTYWVLFELLWRDYFKFVGMKFGPKMFYLQGLGLGNYHSTWKKDKKQFESWASGNTGYPFVDANMRELNATGFMSNRGRQNVASFLTKDLGIDWRLGAEYFEDKLIDYDVTSNWGNWQYQAGVGLDPRTDRHFNVIKQAHDYDAHAEYVLMWVPELSPLKEPGLIHQPWMAYSKQALDYPERIVQVKYGYSASKRREPAPKSKDIRGFLEPKRAHRR